MRPSLMFAIACSWWTTTSCAFA